MEACCRVIAGITQTLAESNGMGGVVVFFPSSSYLNKIQQFGSASPSSPWSRWVSARLTADMGGDVTAVLRAHAGRCEKGVGVLLAVVGGME